MRRRSPPRLTEEPVSVARASLENRDYSKFSHIEALQNVREKAIRRSVSSKLRNEVPVKVIQPAAPVKEQRKGFFSGMFSTRDKVATTANVAASPLVLDLPKFKSVMTSDFESDFLFALEKVQIEQSASDVSSEAFSIDKTPATADRTSDYGSIPFSFEEREEKDDLNESFLLSKDGAAIDNWISLTEYEDAFLTPLNATSAESIMAPNFTRESSAAAKNQLLAGQDLTINNQPPSKAPKSKKRCSLL